MAKTKSKTPEKVSDLVFDDKNFNTGNEFGESLIEKSFSKFGAGRSILIDKNNRIIAGNKSTQKFAEGGGENIIVVETDGKTLIAVKRTDIDLDSPQGREMALADNMSASKNITIDAELVEAELSEAVAVEWGVSQSQQDIENVNEFSENVNFTIKCDNIEQLEKLQSKLNVSSQKISYDEFIKKAVL